MLYRILSLLLRYPTYAEPIYRDSTVFYFKSVIHSKLADLDQFVMAYGPK